MKWFRSNIKHGSRLALLALALQFALSFGHYHVAAAQAGPAIQPAASQLDVAHVLVAPDAADTQQPASHQDPDPHPADACVICAVTALARAALLATPPTLLLPPTVDLPYATTDAEFIHLNFARAFQSRAPPAS